MNNKSTLTISSKYKMLTNLYIEITLVFNDYLAGIKLEMPQGPILGPYSKGSSLYK